MLSSASSYFFNRICIHLHLVLLAALCRLICQGPLIFWCCHISFITLVTLLIPKLSKTLRISVTISSCHAAFFLFCTDLTTDFNSIGLSMFLCIIDFPCLLSWNRFPRNLFHYYNTFSFPIMVVPFFILDIFPNITFSILWCPLHLYFVVFLYISH